MSPKEGEVLTINMVHCKYELVEPVAAASSPTFRVQLDDRDPVRTITKDHTFTGLKEGPHEIFVIVQDANGIPIPGTRNTVHFKVSLPHPGSSGAAASAKPAATPQANLLRTSARDETRAGPSSSASAAAPVQAPPSEGELPDSGSSLPLIAVLCGGALAGGTLSVIRTRGRRTRS